MKKRKYIFICCCLIGGILFLAGRAYAQFLKETNHENQVQSSLRHAPESGTQVKCVYGAGYCVKNGYAIKGMTIKN